ncbi:glutathionylspermidine synthase family protein [Tindallia californiensis]|uniref:Glutathionylspermidine synthase n=1 Tax=Tindallia californiensis TaxID=159292 RepID=A0A1H3L5Z4_9FIRM|nr:glutathionylspermidine synthase family protein [Tindallia californiensis]SDY59354.1 Glutathionylspermidine synthase [Tindallia californiensis]
MKGLPSIGFDLYEQMVKRDPSSFWRDYQEALKEVEASPAKYKGKPVEFLYQPFFLTEEQWEDLEKISVKMLEITKKVTERYLAEPDYRRLFGFNDLMEALILKDPGYHYAVPMTRIDVFYHFDGSFQLCEMNTDGSSGMTECRELQRIIGTSPSINTSPLDELELKEGEFFKSWTTAFLENYRAFSGEKSFPNIAIIDWFQDEVPSEFIEFQKAFETCGCPTRIVDVRELSYSEGKLKAGDFSIDAVYRRLVSWEAVERYPATKALTDAYLDGNVCVVGPFRSQIPHNKRFFAVLHNEDVNDFLEPEEKAFIRNHIPYTAILDKGNPDQWQEWVDHKQHYIIKPEDLYASSGVYAGQDYSVEEWKQLLEKASSQNYLIQQYCHVPRMPMAMFEKGEVTFEEQQYLMGCFVYNEKFQGPYIRTGRKSIIGSVVECYTVPAYRVNK